MYKKYIHIHTLCASPLLLLLLLGARKKNLSIKIEDEKKRGERREEKKTQNAFRKAAVKENGRVERWENEKSFNLQFIIKVVIKRELISHIIRATRSVSERMIVSTFFYFFSSFFSLTTTTISFEKTGDDSDAISHAIFFCALSL
jgi:hypothetical protein